ncbi:MAG: hypothetical protein C4542_08015 [Dehalococcoidia bacterium]|nr:MAG: hypothetical protein C4542_08015 [Dehalococcoidia bacterium]
MTEQLAMLGTPSVELAEKAVRTTARKEKVDRMMVVLAHEGYHVTIKYEPDGDESCVINDNEFFVAIRGSRKRCAEMLEDAYAEILHKWYTIQDYRAVLNSGLEE